ncbi:hypothetical protein [Pilimelia columellifera]|uniref:Uncharacterized protein n=1 Tax=Pilimelia columellifera subsp. columellifera TaxID=706583 RepID=A0ABN3NH83_9ACTN
MFPPQAIAWSAARAFVTATETGAHLLWMSDQIRQLLGPDYQRALAQTRHRVVNPRSYDARLTEADSWRIRIERALERRPHIHPALRELVAEADSRLSSACPGWLQT